MGVNIILCSPLFHTPSIPGRGEVWGCIQFPCKPFPREKFWVFLSFFSDRSVSVPCDKCAQSTTIAEKIKKTLKFPLISKEMVNKVGLRIQS